MAEVRNFVFVSLFQVNLSSLRTPNDLALEDIFAYNLDWTLLTPLQPLSLTSAN